MPLPYPNQPSSGVCAAVAKLSVPSLVRNHPSTPLRSPPSPALPALKELGTAAQHVQMAFVPLRLAAAGQGEVQAPIKVPIGCIHINHEGEGTSVGWMTVGANTMCFTNFLRLRHSTDGKAMLMVACRQRIAAEPILSTMTTPSP